MSKEQITAVLEQAREWPEEDQAELIEYAREIEARRTGVYVLSDEERAAIAQGRAQLDRGEYVGGSDLAAFWKRYT